MTQIEELTQKLEREQAIIDRCNPRLAELKHLIGPWLRATASGIPMTEPVELRAEQAQLQGERWEARNYDETQRELGKAENHARRLMEQIAELSDEIARLNALPCSDERRAARIAEEVRSLTRIRANHERTLAIIGTPRETVEG